MKKEFKTVIFDLDQTLVNTMPLMPYVEAIKKNPNGTHIPVSKDKMIGRFSVNRWRSISFGNCADDILVAHKVGVKAVACLWGATQEEKEEMIKSNPDNVIECPIDIIPLLCR